MEEKILKLLRDERMITDEQCQQAIKECEKTHARPDDVLDRLKILDAARLLEFLSKKSHVPVVKWETYTPNEELFKLIPKKVAEKYTVFPIAYERGRRQGKITLAVVDPSNVTAIDDISYLTKCVVKTEVSSSKAVTQAIQRYYPKDAAAGGAETPAQQERPLAADEFTPSGIPEIDALVDSLARSGEFAGGETDGLAGLDRAHPAAKLLIDILDKSLERGVSEIHIDPFGAEWRVRFRIDGILSQQASFSDQAARQLAELLHRLARQQDRDDETGRFYTSQIRELMASVLVRFYPGAFGEKLLLLLKPGTPRFKIDRLGIDDPSLKMLNRILTKPQGIFLFISPSGHGKTTTLYALFQHLNPAEIPMVSLERTVEACLPHVHQIPISSPRSYQDWYSLLSYLAPDLLSIDSVEDRQMARLAFECSSNTSVLASVTARDVAEGVSIFFSFLDNPQEKRNQQTFSSILDALNGVIAQRLVRKLCPRCKERKSPSEQDIQVIEWLTSGATQDAAFPVYAAKGCHECLETGYHGQTGIFELLKFDKPLKEFLGQQYPISAYQLRQFLADIPMNTFKQQSLQKLREGVTSPEEIRRVVMR